MKIAFHTFGCKLNQVETEAIASRFKAEGFSIYNGEDADLFFINTCAVTGKAEAKSRRLIRALAKRNPGKVIAAGCLAQLKPLDLAALGNLKLVLGNEEKFEPVKYLTSPEKIFVNPDFNCQPHLSPCYGQQFRSRIFFKIQDGCDHGCSYCLVPKLRGKSVSLPASVILNKIQSILKENPNEVVLTGVDIGSYYDPECPDLAELLSRLVALPEVVRLRLSSLEPPGCSPRLINVCTQSPQICPHFHLPLQSGSDRILKLMGRKYSAREYMQILEKFERKLPLVRLGADVIVGFPTESDDDFKKTYQLIKDTPLTHLHIFPFSIRPYTRFSADDDNIPPEVKARRARVLRNLINRKNELFLRKNLGTTASVFFEGDGNRGGLTGNYIRVQVPNSKISCFAQIKLLGIKGKVVTGEMVH